MAIAANVKDYLASISAARQRLVETLGDLPDGEWTTSMMRGEFSAMSTAREAGEYSAKNRFANAQGAAHRLYMLIELGLDSSLGSHFGIERTGIQPAMDAARAAIEAVGTNRSGDHRAAFEGLAGIAATIRKP